MTARPPAPARTVLVTGATGFIGRNVIEPLRRRGFDVHALVRRGIVPDLPADRLHPADLLERDGARDMFARIRPSHLLHLAWFAVPGEYWTSLENHRWVRASLELLQAFAAEGGQRVVMAGTCAEYDWTSGHCVENVTPLRPSTLYGVCKLETGERVLADAPGVGVSAAWGRIFFLYGPHEDPRRLVPSVAASLLRGERAACTHGNQTRDFLHVSDVAGAFAALLDSQVSGAVNIASGEPVAVRDVIMGVAERVGRPDLVDLGTRPMTEPMVLTADVRRLRDEVGWVPRYGLGSGLDDTVEWWRRRISTGG